MAEERLKFSWEKEEEADGYSIQRYIEDDYIELVRIENINITSIIIPNVKPGIENHIRVCLFRKKDGKPYVYKKDDYYCFVKGKVALTYRFPIPRLMEAERLAKGIAVSWEKCSERTMYLIMRRTKGGKWEKIGMTQDASFIDYNIDLKQKYIYTVRCISNDGKQNLSGFSLKGIMI